MGQYISVLKSAAQEVRDRHKIGDTFPYLVNCAFMWYGHEFFSKLPRATAKAEQPVKGIGEERGLKRSMANDSTFSSDERDAAAFMVKAMTDSDEGTSCHLIAKNLMSLLCTGPDIYSAKRPDPSLVVANEKYETSANWRFLNDCVKKVGTNCCVRVNTYAHSFVIIKNNAQIEVIEAWAGNQGGSKPLDDDLDERRRRLLVADMKNGIKSFLHPNRATRDDGFERFSLVRSGYFDDPSISTMKLKVRALATTAAFGRDVTGLLDRTAQLGELMRSVTQSTGNKRRKKKENL
jgi:hypothetical protein